MKKIIAISVMLALVATGAVFAQPTISGAIETRVNVVGGDDVDDTYLWTGLGGGALGTPIGTAWIQISGANDTGTFGGTFRLRGQDIAIADPFRWHKAYTWWRPVPQLRVFFGVDADGMFSTGDALFDWAFHNGSEGFMNLHNWDFWRTIFPGHWDGFGMALTATPIDGLTLNLVVPIGAASGWPRHDTQAVERRHRTVDVLGGLQLSGSFAIPDIGTILFSYVGPGRWFGDIGEVIDPAIQPGLTTPPNPDHYGLIGASFLLTSLPGLRIQAGGSTWIPYDGSDQNINLGLGVHYTGGDWGVRFRTGVVLMQDENLISFNVMPWYRLGQTELRLDFGMSLWSDLDDAGWWVNPYIRHSVAGGGYIQAGVIVHTGIAHTENPQAPGNAEVLNFRVPLLFGISW